MVILGTLLLHVSGSAVTIGWDELAFLAVPAAIVLTVGLVGRRGDGGRKPEAPTFPELPPESGRQSTEQRGQRRQRSAGKSAGQRSSRRTAR